MAAGAGALAELRPRLLSGHYWTVAAYLRDRARPPLPPESRRFELVAPDLETPDLRLTGRLSEAGQETLLIVLHGIAGNCDSHYAARCAAAAQRVGWACLRLNLRGADRSGQDFFHAGLTDDLHSVLACSELAAYRAVHLLGYSLGGHVALRAATQELDARVRSVAAICSPLDLAECATAFDRPVSWVYRRRILTQLISGYERVAENRQVAVPAEVVRRVRSLRDFDNLTVAPRFGFEDAEDYYRRMSVGPILNRLRVPALLVAGVSDPLVPIATHAPFLGAARNLDVAYAQPGGHVGFPADLSLGIDAPAGLESQALAWLSTRGQP